MRGNPQLMGILSGFLAAISFFIAHLLAIYIAHSIGSGFGGALLTLVLPIVSEIYWIEHLWEKTGSFANALTFLSGASVVLTSLTYALSVASREAA
jgi:uncharacterized membrane protein YhhN